MRRLERHNKVQQQQLLEANREAVTTLEILHGRLDEGRERAPVGRMEVGGNLQVRH